MKYFISIFVLIFGAIAVTSLYAHTNRLHKNHVEIQHDRTEKAASIRLLEDNKFNDQMKSLKTLQEKISTQCDPETQLKNLNRYITELQNSIDTMQELVNQYGSEADYIVVTHGDNVLPISYRFTMIRQLLQSTIILQQFMINHLKYQEGNLPACKP